MGVSIRRLKALRVLTFHDIQPKHVTCSGWIVFLTSTATSQLTAHLTLYCTEFNCISEDAAAAEKKKKARPILAGQS